MHTSGATFAKKEAHILFTATPPCLGKPSGLQKRQPETKERKYSKRQRNDIIVKRGLKSKKKIEELIGENKERSERDERRESK